MTPDPLGALLGSLEVVTTVNGGHKPEFWAERACAKIMDIADTAPMPIREQAIAFKQRMEQVILYYMRQAIASDRTTVVHIVNEAGQDQLAEHLRSG